MLFQGIDVQSDNAVELAVEDGRIVSVHRIENKDNLPYISPGFFDIQVNGYKGSDYSSETLSSADILHVIESLSPSGTTRHIPTLVTAPQKRLLRNLAILAEARKTRPQVEAAIPGYHIEGPFISSEDGPRGAHDPLYIRNPDYQEYLEWQEAAEGLIKIVTLAPELEGAFDFIEKIVNDGTIASIGHTGASPDIIRKAIDAGASLSTHLGNGSHGMIPRLNNYIWEQLASDDLTIGLISDSFHLPESVVRVFLKVKGLSKLILVSDVAVLGGSSPGTYKWGNIDVEVFPDGHLGLAGTSYLAGAAHLLDWNIPRFMEYTGSSLKDTIRLCTENPIRLLGLSSEPGPTVKEGAPANLVQFRYKKHDKRLSVEKTILKGEEIFSSSP
jgi:N-acetylglucosamine-6-phosphate deacetylase